MKVNTGIKAYKTVDEVFAESESDLNKKVIYFRRTKPKINMRQTVDIDTDEVCTEPR